MKFSSILALTALTACSASKDAGPTGAADAAAPTDGGAAGANGCGTHELTFAASGSNVNTSALSSKPSPALCPTLRTVLDKQDLLSLQVFGDDGVTASGTNNRTFTLNLNDAKGGITVGKSYAIVATSGNLPEGVASASFLTLENEKGAADSPKKSWVSSGAGSATVEALTDTEVVVRFQGIAFAVETGRPNNTAAGTFTLTGVVRFTKLTRVKFP
jgi:hypothetical protein